MSWALSSNDKFFEGDENEQRNDPGTCSIVNILRVLMLPVSVLGMWVRVVRGPSSVAELYEPVFTQILPPPCRLGYNEKSRYFFFGRGCWDRHSERSESEGESQVSVSCQKLCDARRGTSFLDFRFILYLPFKVTSPFNFGRNLCVMFQTCFMFLSFSVVANVCGCCLFWDSFLSFFFFLFNVTTFTTTRKWHNGYYCMTFSDFFFLAKFVCVELNVCTYTYRQIQ